MFVRTVSLALVLFMPFVVQGKEIKYNHNSVTVSEVKEKASFPVFAPNKIPDDWTLEIKTQPKDKNNRYTAIALHYMDKEDTILMLNISQSRNKSKIKKYIGDKAEEININEHVAYFEAWANIGEIRNGRPLTGGILKWEQEGTLIEMDSSEISKDIMVSIARSMKIIN